MDELRIDVRPFGPPDRRAVVLPVPWRALRRESVIRGDDGALYVIVRSGWGRAGHWSLTLVCGPWREQIEGSADDPAEVLLPGAVVAAIELCRAQLGARLIAAYRTESGGDAPDLIWRGETTGDGAG
jgi:hypothetical protein